MLTLRGLGPLNGDAEGPWSMVSRDKTGAYGSTKGVKKTCKMQEKPCIELTSIFQLTSFSLNWCTLLREVKES